MSEKKMIQHRSKVFGILLAGEPFPCRNPIKNSWYTLVLSTVTVFMVACGGAVEAPQPATSTSSGSSLAISTSSLPDGTEEQSYQATVTATGGTSPYTWRLLSGTLPPGLALDTANGEISGTPTQAGQFMFTVEVEDSAPSPQTATQTFNVTIDPAASLQIITSGLPTARINDPYQVTLSATGGLPPYTWRIIAGALPLGLMLGAASGEISGTPQETGQFNITVEVEDSSSTPQTASKAFDLTVVQGQLDKFGGLIDAPCPSGPATHFYQEKIGDRWVLCTPEGNAFWSLGIFNITANSRADDLGKRYRDVVKAKYGNSDLTWGPQQVKRIRSWGFNTVGDFSVKWTWPTATNNKWPNGEQPEKMPYVVLWRAALSALNNQTKSLFDCVGSIYTGFKKPMPDVFDPTFQSSVASTADNLVANGNDSPWTIGVVSDETDKYFGFGAGASNDFATVPPGKNNPHLGWIVLINKPNIARASECGEPFPQFGRNDVTYTDTTNHSKVALRDFLQARYGTLSALNTAWGSNYTSWGSNGTWGTGTAFLDEAGQNSWVCSDDDNLTGCDPDMKQDLDDFLFELAQKHFSIVDGELDRAMPGVLHLGPSVLGSWGTPPRPQILQAASLFLELGQSQLDVSDQARIDFFFQHFGDRPIMLWEGAVANPDSSQWRWSTGAGIQFNTQEERGTWYQQELSRVFNAAVSSTGSKPIIGIRVWEFVDNTGEHANWGFVSTLDNAYDGFQADNFGCSAGNPASCIACVDPDGLVDNNGNPVHCGAEEVNSARPQPLPNGDFIGNVRQANQDLIDALRTELSIP